MPKQWICFCQQQGILMIIDLNLMETSCPHDKKKGAGGLNRPKGVRVIGGI
jgi:hypothetical protein